MDELTRSSTTFFNAGKCQHSVCSDTDGTTYGGQFGASHRNLEDSKDFLFLIGTHFMPETKAIFMEWKHLSLPV